MRLFTVSEEHRSTSLFCGVLMRQQKVHKSSVSSRTHKHVANGVSIRFADRIGDLDKRDVHRCVFRPVRHNVNGLAVLVRNSIGEWFYELRSY